MPQGSSREEAAFCELEKAVRRGDIQIGVATVKYNQPGDSFHRRWESSIPGFSILGVVIYSFTVGWVHGGDLGHMWLLALRDSCASIRHEQGAPPSS